MLESVLTRIIYCLSEGAIIVLVCIIFSVFAAYLRSVILNVVAVRMVLRYIEALVSNMLVLASAGKMEDRVVKEMLDSYL